MGWIKKLFSTKKEKTWEETIEYWEIKDSKALSLMLYKTQIDSLSLKDGNAIVAVLIKRILDEMDKR